MWGTSSVACWVVLVVFLCLHVFTARIVGGGCGCVFGLGINVVMDEHTVGFTFNTVLASAIVVVVARIAC